MQRLILYGGGKASYVSHYHGHLLGLSNLEFLILIRVLLSWVNVSPYHPAIRLLYQITDPVLRPLRRVIPPIGGVIDISPVVALILLEILKRVVVSALVSL